MKRLRLHEGNNHKNKVACNLNANPSQKIVRAVKVLGIIFLAVFVLEVWLMNRLSTYGNKIQELEVAKSNLKLENQVLENEIAQKASLNLIDQKAAGLGFNNIKNIEYIKPLNIASIQ